VLKLPVRSIPFHSNLHPLVDAGTNTKVQIISNIELTTKIWFEGAEVQITKGFDEGMYREMRAKVM
jgi:hypothetical protein